MTEEKHHITPYKTYLAILGLLIVLTLLSVAITQIELSQWSTIAALLLAGIKSIFILSIFMHLRFDQKMYKIMVGLVIALLVVVIIITMLDFLFR